MMFNLPLQIVGMLCNFKPDWLIAGGWAIDLFLEKETRSHKDIDIAVFRKDQAALHDYFDDWLLRKAVDGKLVVWHRDEWLKLPIHEIHCYKDTTQPPQIEILLNESNETDWLYRRNGNIRRSLIKTQLESSAGVKFLCPEIVLLYKSKNLREKDELDFQAVVERLDAERKEWLKDAIKVCNSKHHWLRSL